MCNKNALDKINTVSTEAHNTSKEPIFLSSEATTLIKELRNMDGGLMVYQSLICESMSNLTSFMDADTSTEREKKAYINIMTTLRLYNELITALAEGH